MWWFNSRLLHCFGILEKIPEIVQVRFIHPRHSCLFLFISSPFFRVVRYEDLSLDIYNQSKNLFDFFRLSYHPNVEKFLSTHTTETIGGVSSTFRNSKTAPFHWRQDLIWEEVSFIQSVCKKPLQLWGYQSAKGRKHLRTFNPINESFSFPPTWLFVVIVFNQLVFYHNHSSSALPYFIYIDTVPCYFIEIAFYIVFYCDIIDKVYPLLLFSSKHRNRIIQLFPDLFSKVFQHLSYSQLFWSVFSPCNRCKKRLKMKSTTKKKIVWLSYE